MAHWFRAAAGLRAGAAASAKIGRGTSKCFFVGSDMELKTRIAATADINAPRARIYPRAETTKAREESTKFNKGFSKELKDLLAHVFNKLKHLIAHLKHLLAHAKVRSLEFGCLAYEKAKKGYEMLNRNLALLCLVNLLTLIGHAWTVRDTYDYLSGREEREEAKLKEEVKKEVKAEFVEAMKREQEIRVQAIKDIREEWVRWRAESDKKIRGMITAVTEEAITKEAPAGEEEE